MLRQEEKRETRTREQNQTWKSWQTDVGVGGEMCNELGGGGEAETDAVDLFVELTESQLVQPGFNRRPVSLTPRYSQLWIKLRPVWPALPAAVVLARWQMLTSCFTHAVETFPSNPSAEPKKSSTGIEGGKTVKKKKKVILLVSKCKQWPFVGKS